MSQSAVSSVLVSLGNLAVKETTFLCGVSHEVEFVKDELIRLQAYLKDADNKRRSGNARVAALVSQIRDASYDAQNVIEAAGYVEKRNRLKKGFVGAISRYSRLPSDLVTLHKVGAELQHFRRKLNEIFASAEKMGIDLDSSATMNSQVNDESSQDHSLMYQNAEDDIIMVGFEDDHMEIADKLVRGGQMLSVVSIVAMGGAGKTTLARKVYTSSIVKQHFNAFAWVTVSQKFKGVDLLKDIMKQIMVDEANSVEQLQEVELGKKINNFLSQKKFVVVLDDVWEEDTWEEMNRLVKAFPDEKNGSRILLTTRKERVATHVEMPTHVHVLKGLDEEKSWELFSTKALPQYRRSMLDDVTEFEEIGRMLAKRCDGLPLALAVLGGYLSKNLSVQTWSDVLSSWPSTRNTQIMRDILARSYYDLADLYLRSCFLYLASFPEDRRIDVSMLITLWMAESFIPRARKHEVEETARKYVAELAQRNLVQVTSRSIAHGWIEEIRVHDILREWCIEEGRADGFLDVVDGTSGQSYAPSSDIMTSYRSSYQDFGGQKFQPPPNLRTLMGFILQTISLPKLRFLRVLHIEDSVLENFSTAIEWCIQLRCLRLIHCSVDLPSSIRRLIYLQTIDIRRTGSPIPKSMWDIPSLRHVYLDRGISPPRGEQQTELQTLWLCDLRSAPCSQVHYHDMVRFLGQLTELKTLWLEIHPSIPSEVMSIFANLARLVDVHLDTVSAIDKLPESNQFPQNLRSFELYADAIKQDPMTVLEKFPCLVVLKLTGYTGRTMSCSTRGFPRLQFLELYQFPDTEHWKIEVGAMPKLSRLILHHFMKLSLLPEGLLELRYSVIWKYQRCPYVLLEMIAL